jgi:L-asparagine transporter-like permease
MKNDWYKYFNYGTIIFVAILLVLIIANLIPKNLYIPILVLTIIIFILRIVGRVYYTIQSKKKNQEG